MCLCVVVCICVFGCVCLCVVVCTHVCVYVCFMGVLILKQGWAVRVANSNHIHWLGTLRVRSLIKLLAFGIFRMFRCPLPLLDYLLESLSLPGLFGIGEGGL